MSKDLLARIKGRSSAREQTISGYIRYAVLRELKQPLEDFPPLNLVPLNSTEPKANAS